MRFYLRLKSIPELSELPASERRIAWHGCRRRTWQRWQTWVGTLVAAAIGGGLGWGSLKLFVWLSPFDRRMTYFLGGFVCGAVIVGVTETLRSVVVASQIRPFLQEYLAGRVGGDSSAQGGNTKIDYLEEPFNDSDDGD